MVRLCDILCSQNRTAQGVFPCGRQERRSQQQRRKVQQARRTQRQRQKPYNGRNRRTAQRYRSAPNRQVKACDNGKYRSSHAQPQQQKAGKRAPQRRFSWSVVPVCPAPKGRPGFSGAGVPRGKAGMPPQQKAKYRASFAVYPASSAASFSARRV